MVVNFTASWCGKCKVMAPKFEVSACNLCPFTCLIFCPAAVCLPTMLWLLSLLPPDQAMSEEYTDVLFYKVDVDTNSVSTNLSSFPPSSASICFCNVLNYTLIVIINCLSCKCNL